MESLQWKRRSVNRAIRWHPVPGGAELEADTRDVAMVLRDLGLEKATPVVSPVAKRPKAEVLLLAGPNPAHRMLRCTVQSPCE